MKSFFQLMLAHKWLGGLVLCFALAVAGLSITSVAQQPETANTVLPESIFVRSGPGQQYVAVGALYQGNTVRPLNISEDGAWVLILYRRQYGWIQRSLVQWANEPGLNALPTLQADITPTSLFGPTLTPFIPTETPIGSYVAVTDAASIFVRGGPGRGYLRLGDLRPGALVEPVARNADTSWIMIRYTNETSQFDGFGWVQRPLVRWGSDIVLDALPVVSEADLTPSPTFTPSNTPTTTPTATLTATPTATETLTSTPTVTNSPTATPTVTPSATITESATPTLTLTPTFTATTTPTETATVTATQTEMPPRETQIAATTQPLPNVAFQTNTPRPSATLTHTTAPMLATNTLVPTITPSTTPSNTPTVTVTSSATATSTHTPSATVTETASATFTPTSTETLPVIVTEAAPLVLPSQTNTPTVTASATVTPSATPTTTATVTASPTLTDTASPTATVTLTLTATLTPTATETSVPQVAAIPVSPTPTPVTVVDAPSGGSGFSLEIFLAVVVLALLLGYGLMYWRGLTYMQQYDKGFVIDRCLVCGRGHLTVETRPERMLGIPIARHVVHCNECRSLLRATGRGRWRYAVDRFENPAFYDKFNGRIVTEDELSSLSRGPVIIPPTFEDDVNPS